MLWSILFISLSLASARNVGDFEQHALDSLIDSDQAEEISQFLEGVQQAANDVPGRQKAMFNRVSELGDILLTKEQERQGINFQKYTSYKWPNGELPYTIKRSHFTRADRRKIEYAIDDLNQRLAAEGGIIQLVPRSSQPDYVTVINGQGCYSYLGRVGGEQALSLQRNGCIYNTTIQHEFMHALGFTHEQNRYDRDNFVEVLWDNIPENWHSQYEKVDENDFINIGDYEDRSIMHYPWWAPDSGGKDAFDFKGRNVNKYELGEGENDGATPMDIKKINTLYTLQD